MKKQKQKKLLVIAAIVLMIGLVSGMGAMTYARYITSSQVPAQQATAAKWGFVVTADTSKLFSTDYTLVSGQYATPTTLDNGIAVNAHADTLGDIVAPGTSGSMTVTISGIAEVRARLSLKSLYVDSQKDYLDISIPEGTDPINGDRAKYNPVKWTLSKKVGSAEAEDVVGAPGVDLETLLTAFENESTDIPAGSSTSVVYTISWKWDFNAGNDVLSLQDTLIGYKSAGLPYEGATDDVKDLSDALAYDGKTYAAHISLADYNAITTQLKLGFTVTIEQIQEATPNP